MTWVTITFGTDTYGKVKSVQGVSVVTTFAMFQFLPIYPVESFYLMTLGPLDQHGIPFGPKRFTREFQGLPLSKLDALSVATAYLRGVFAFLAVLGSLVLVPGYSLIRGEQLDEVAMLIVKILIGSLLIGLVGGGLSYILCPISAREKSIRACCGELLGIAIDPARIPPDWNQSLLAETQAADVFDTSERDRLIRRLVQARVRMADADEEDSAERLTDELLESLRLTDVSRRGSRL